MEKDLLKHLNKFQKQAVEQYLGPVLILAGAGSGKTRVLTHKVVHLILEKQVNPTNILMVTFTNKAAGEMKERIIKLLNIEKEADLPFVGTFHSLCVRILKRHGNFIKIQPNFVIYDATDRKKVIKEVLEKLDLDKKRYKPRSIASLISGAKNELITSLEYLNIARGHFQETAAKIYLEYQKQLKKNNALDFDDLIFFTVKLLKEDKNIASIYQDIFQYILVDEYQDTNHAQYILTKLLSKKWKNITVVGDASQSIYNFRGADFRNITNFQKDYKDTKVFHLEKNYRSTQTILDAAYSVISQNRSHPILKLFTDNSRGRKVCIYQAKDERDEAYNIVNQVVSYLSKRQNNTYSDFAVLYRTNAQSRVIEEVFLKSAIPYILVGGVRFYERKEVKDILSYLKVLHNKNDQVSWNRIEKLGKRRLKKFFSFYQEFQVKLLSKKISTTKILDEVLKASSYLERFDKEKEEDISRLENIQELYSVASLHPTLEQFLEAVSLIQHEYLPSGKTGFYTSKSSFSKKENGVTLTTIHAAKGLEFKNIFLVGLEEGLFPHARSVQDLNGIEEERRLCYVGITRAMENLFLSYAAERLYFGLRSSNQISRFLLDIPENLTNLTTHNAF